MHHGRRRSARALWRLLSTCTTQLRRTFCLHPPKATTRSTYVTCQKFSRSGVKALVHVGKLMTKCTLILDHHHVLSLLWKGTCVKHIFLRCFALLCTAFALLHWLTERFACVYCTSVQRRACSRGVPNSLSKKHSSCVCGATSVFASSTIDWSTRLTVRGLKTC